MSDRTDCPRCKATIPPCGHFDWCPDAPLQVANARIKELEALNDELLDALNHLGAAVRLADSSTAMTVGFVWEQNRDHILAGRSTWADQKVPPPTFGGMTFDASITGEDSDHE